MKFINFFIPVLLLLGCSPGTTTEQEQVGIRIDDTYTIEEFTADDLMEWEFHGMGTVAKQGSQLLLSESEGSKGVILVSPSSYGKNIIVSYDVMTLTPASVLVVMLSSSNTESQSLEIESDYDGSLSTLRDLVSFYMIAFHNAPHNRFPFINKYPKEGGNKLQEAEKTFMHPGIYYHIDVAQEGDNISLFIDGRKVLDVVDTESLPGGKFVFRARGTGHLSASCLIRNLKIYSKN